MDGLGHQVAHRKDAFAQLHLAGVDLGEVEYVIDQVEQMGAGLVHVAGIFGIAGIAERAEEFGLEDFRKAQNGVERSAQLMAHAGEKF